MAFFAITAFFYASCSGDDSSSSVGDDAAGEYTMDDSTKVLAYTYSRFLSNNDVKIVDEDTTRLSVDTAFANKVEEGLPSVANVIAVWDNIKNAPYYVRVKKVQKKEGRLLIDVDKATVYDAMPDGNFEFSSEIFFDPSKVKENDAEIPPEAFYDEEKGIYHPVVLIPYDQKASDENDDDKVDVVDMKKNPLETLAQKNGYVDVREMIKSNADKNVHVFDIHKELYPGTMSIPGTGATIGGYQGSWLDAFGGMDKLQAAFAKANGKNSVKAWSPLKAYIRVDTISFKYSADLYMKFEIKWLKPKIFECYFKTYAESYISNIGIGIGAGISGEKQLTYFTGWTLVFSIGVIPISVTITPNLYFKYNAEAYGLLDWRLQYRYKKSSTQGVKWTSGDGASLINSSSEEKNINKFRVDDVVICGKASAALMVRIAALLYGTAGPTIGSGFRFDLNAQIGAAAQYDNEGNRTGVSPSGHVKLTGAIPFEAGAEVKIAKWTLFKRSWDLFDFKTFNFIDQSFGEKK